MRFCFLQQVFKFPLKEEKASDTQEVLVPTMSQILKGVNRASTIQNLYAITQAI